MSMICILCIALSIIICEAKTVLYLNECGTVLDVFSDSNDNNIYILCSVNNNYNIVTINNSLNTCENIINIDVNNKTYAYANDTFYFFSKEEELNSKGDVVLLYTIIDSYNCKTGMSRQRVINNAVPEIHGTFAVDSDGNYYMISKNNVEVYTSNYKYLKTISVGYNIINLTNSPDGAIVYVIYENKLKIIDNNRIYDFNISANKVYAGNNGFFSTDRGEIYNYGNGNVSAVYSGFDGIHGGAVIGDNIFVSKLDSLTAVNNDSEFSVEEINSETYIKSLGNKCICINQYGNSVEVKMVTEEDVKLKQSELNSSQSENNQNVNKTLSSDIYNINYNDNVITGITPGSTIAEIKNNIRGESFTFYDNKGNIKKSGVIGTGSIIENTETKERFCVIIYGELSGEGNINSVDKTVLANHILEAAELEGVYLTAADINGDSQVNLKDYVALDSYMKGTYSINQNR